MIDLHCWTTPNGHKNTIFLEEVGLPYTIKLLNTAGPTVNAETSRRIHFGQDRSTLH